MNSCCRFISYTPANYAVCTIACFSFELIIVYFIWKLLLTTLQKINISNKIFLVNTFH